MWEWIIQELTDFLPLATLVCWELSWEQPQEPSWTSQVAPVVKNPPANAGYTGDVGWIPESGRSPGGRHSNPLQYSHLENLMDRGAWWATIYRVAKSQTQLSTYSHPGFSSENLTPWEISVSSRETGQPIKDYSFTHLNTL